MIVHPDQMSKGSDRFGNQQGLAVRHVSAASLVYLALPNLIFVMGWLRWELAATCAGLILVPIFSLRSVLSAFAGEDGDGGARYLPPRQVVVVIVIACALLLLSGVGGVGYQENDWLKHNALLKDLIEHPWPVFYQGRDYDLPLTYYFAYLLPAALAGKIGGWVVANQILFLWTWIGLVLALLWATLLIRPGSVLAPVIFVAFSGLDIVGTPITNPGRLSAGGWDHVEWWAAQWQYSSNVTLLYWVPHQALAAWIAMGLILWARRGPIGRPRVAFLVALLPLWSPFVTLGVLLYVIADFFAGRGWLQRALSYCTMTNLCGLLLLLLYALFFGSRLNAGSLPVLDAPTPHGLIFFAPREPAGWSAVLAQLPLFCLFEFGFYALALAGTAVIRAGHARSVFVVTVASLCLLPLYRYGHNNDAVMRVSIPALFVLCVLVGRALLDPTTAKLRRMALAALLGLGSLATVIDHGRHLTAVVARGALIRLPPAATVPDLWELCQARYPGTGMMRNYVGSRDSVFFRFLAKGGA